MNIAFGFVQKRYGIVVLFLLCAIAYLNFCSCKYAQAEGTVVTSSGASSDTAVWAWGYNGYGQLGIGSVVNRKRPVMVGGLSNVVYLAGGHNHSLALKSDGKVWAWGHNIAGQLGIGSTMKKIRFPVQVSKLSSVVDIASGAGHSLALKLDGTVWTCGGNFYGQLGNNSTTDSKIPVQVKLSGGSALNDVIAIAGGYLHSLALRSDGKVWAWGFNGYGQLGNNSTTDSKAPVQVTGLSDVVAIAGGAYHNLALKSDGTVLA